MGNKGKNNAEKPRKKQNKKNAKSIVKKMENMTLVHKAPSSSKNVEKRIAKNIVLNNREMFTNKQIAKIMLSVCAPKEYPPVRLGSQFCSYQTGVVNPYAVVRTSWAPVAASDSSGVNQTVAMLFRDPFRMLAHSYNWETNDFSYSAGVTGVRVSGDWIPLQFGGLGWKTGIKPHGQTLFPGRMSGSKRCWVPVVFGQAMIFNNMNGLNSFDFRCYLWDGNVIQNGAIITVPPSSSGGILDNALINSSLIGVGVRYMSWDVKCGTSSAAIVLSGELTLSRGTSTVGFGFRAAPYIESNYIGIDAFKVYGASLMLTNNAAPLYRQGKVAIAQIPAGNWFQNVLTYADVSTVKDSKTFELQNGCYGFLKATQPRDIDFVINHELLTGIYVNTYSTQWFDLDVPSDYLVMAAECTTEQGRDTQWSYATAIEYRTNDQWRDARLPTISAAVVNEAMTLISHVPQFHENPFHMSDILDWIGDRLSELWGGVKTAAPYVMDGLKEGAKLGAMAALTAL